MKLAIGDNDSKSISGETLARGENQDLDVLKQFDNEFQAFVGDNHPLELDLLKPGVGSDHGRDPMAHISAPTLGDQIEVGEVRLPLDGDGSNLGEAVDDGGRRDGVAVLDEDSSTALVLNLVLGLADERDRASVLVIVDEGEHVLQHLLRERVIYSWAHV